MSVNMNALGGNKMNKANIIHLSDIHFDNSEQNSKLLDALEKDLLDMKEELKEFHVLIITGDCVDRGKVDLFNDFSKKLDTIIKKCEISKKKVIITIGNHDVDLKNPWILSLKQSIDENNNLQDTIYSIDGRISELYREYNQFDKKYKETPDGIGVIDIPIKAKTGRQIMKLRIISLNSSWSTVINNRYGELVIGNKQLDNLKNKIKSMKQNCDYTILCMHHPLDWFKYEERKKIEEFIEEFKVNFIFHGHIHTSDIKNINSIDENTAIFCTGISYKKAGENSSSKSGMRYSIYQIDKNTKTMNTYIRLTNEKGNFVEDTILYENVKKGFFTVPLENAYKCLLPFKSVGNKEHSSLMLTRDNVERILSKEKKLYNFYCFFLEKINNNLNQHNEMYESFKDKWEKDKNIKKMSSEQENKCKEEFRACEFGMFCYDILIHLNTLFFDGNVRFLIRKYDKKKNAHIAFFADGKESINIEEITEFKWKEGLIYYSFKEKAALLKSANMKYFKNGKSDIWLNSLTIAVDGIITEQNSESIPLLSINIAITDPKEEACLEALAISSIFEIIRDIFKLYNDKVYNIEKIIMEEN